MTQRGDGGVPGAVVTALAEGRCRNAFDVLGAHPLRGSGGRDWVVRAFIPWARSVTLVRAGRRTAMGRISNGGLFEARFPHAGDLQHYELGVVDPDGREWPVHDPYRFGPFVDERRVRSFLKGHERRVHEVLGAVPMEADGVSGTLFAVWAPHALALNLMGDMNGWDARCHPMRLRGDTGVWELFVPGVGVGARYKYQIVTTDGSRLEKADPCGRAVELRPATASEVWHRGRYEWSDQKWMSERSRRDHDTAPMCVYETHLGSWRRRKGSETARDASSWLSYRQLADELLPYVLEQGFTHVELLPITEHPLDESWGYQPLGFFAPTSRYGTPDDFRHFVDRAHELGIGVILDWVPGHFPRDDHGLALFDGTTLYEHPDPRQAEHPDWGTLVFDYGKPAVRSFLVSSAIHWLEDYHVDGLRVDAVASMLYLDYSRPEGEWERNPEGGNENLEAVSMLRYLNDAVHAECPGALMIAEESTAWPRVSHGTDRGGLGFDQKWNLGWMSDVLEVMSHRPEHRSGHYHRLPFSLVYAFSERFVLPLSHDEVAHGKGSLLSKMPGPIEERLANLRLLLAYQWAHPGKKILFMGAELGQEREWDSGGSIDWALLDDPERRQVQALVRELNRLHVTYPALHALDFRPEGFEWLDCHDADRATLSFIRWAPGWIDPVIVVANFGPDRHPRYELPVPFAGPYEVVLDTTSVNPGARGPEEEGRLLESREKRRHGRDHVVELPLEALSALYLVQTG